MSAFTFRRGFAATSLERNMEPRVHDERTMDERGLVRLGGGHTMAMLSNSVIRWASQVATIRRAGASDVGALSRISSDMGSWVTRFEARPAFRSQVDAIRGVRELLQDSVAATGRNHADQAVCSLQQSGDLLDQLTLAFRR